MGTKKKEEKGMNLEEGGTVRSSQLSKYHDPGLTGAKVLPCGASRV